MKMYRVIQNDFSGVKEIKLEDFKKLNSKEIIIVDVRNSKEQSISMIKGAITLDQFEKNPNKYKDKKIIAYCTIGYRSGKFVKEISKKGFDAYNLEGSILGWIHHQGPLVDQNKQQTKRIHVYGSSWDLPPDGYTSTH